MQPKVNKIKQQNQKINIMRTLNEITASLTDEQKQLLADTIRYGFWGDSEMAFAEGEIWCNGYITNDAYRGGHFERKTLSIKFQGLFKALELKGDKYGKENGEMMWIHDWWGDGSGSVLFIRSELCNDFEQWAKNYNATK